MSTKSSVLDLPRTHSASGTILWSGLVAGLLDATAGVIVYFIWFSYNPFQVLQFIAAGVWGPGAFEGGFPMVLAGLGLHFLIAFVVATIYFMAYPKIALLRQYKVAAGLVYGVGIWLVMNLLVVPNSNIPPAPFDGLLAFVGILWHAVLVGLPIALITARYYDAPAGR